MPAPIGAARNVKQDEELFRPTPSIYRYMDGWRGGQALALRQSARLTEGSQLSIAQQESRHVLTGVLYLSQERGA